MSRKATKVVRRWPRRQYVLTWKPSKGRHRGLVQWVALDTKAILVQEVRRIERAGATEIMWAVYELKKA